MKNIDWNTLAVGGLILVVGFLAYNYYGAHIAKSGPIKITKNENFPDVYYTGSKIN
jgi:hypothetical protein